MKKGISILGIVIICCIIFWTAMIFAIKGCVDMVNEKGLKNIANEMWEGKEEVK